MKAESLDHVVLTVADIGGSCMVLKFRMPGMQP